VSDETLLEELNKALALHQAGCLNEAEAIYRAVLAEKPTASSALNLLGVLHHQKGDNAKAVELISQAIIVKENYADYHNNLGVALLGLNRRDEAKRAFKATLVLDPNHAGAWSNLSAICGMESDYAGAAEACAKVLELNPNEDGSALCHLRLYLDMIGQWDYREELKGAISAAIQLRTDKRIHPWTTLSLELSAEEQLRCADRFAWAISAKVRSIVEPFTHNPRPRRDRLRVGWLSGDFRNHALGILAVECLEYFDRQRFESIAYSFGPDDGSELRLRFEKAFDRFVEIGALSFAEAARKIASDEVDILVDLTGHIAFARTEIVALHPAPIQVNWLGYPGTLGGGLCDYILADAVVIPEGEEINYSEAVARLPFSFQANDRRRKISGKPQSRAEHGLPENSFVFSALNNSFKISPAIFEIWMRLLGQVPGSVLWMLSEGAEMEKNFRQSARERGVDPARIIFAKRAPVEEHRARLKLADLLLDTYPCGAHTTASESLWVGLPVVTLIGEAFASRVAASLLYSVGLGQLVADSLDGYEALALRLATHPDELAVIRQHLIENGEKLPLFDTPRLAKDIGRAFDRMWENFAADKPPASFSLER
jgi:protein O-GlcNAc transferase